jgi:hypothetical protein
MPGDNLLDLFLAGSGFSLSLSIPGINILGDYFVDNNLISIILIKAYINSPRACFISTAITYFLGVFMWSAEKEFVFDRSVPDNL